MNRRSPRAIKRDMDNTLGMAMTYVKAGEPKYAEEYYNRVKMLQDELTYLRYGRTDVL